MKKKRILFVIGAMGRGGKERRLQVLLKHLSGKENYEIHFAIRNDHIAYHEYKDYDLKYYQILTGNESKNPLKVMSRLYRLTKKIQPDLIQVWGSACATYMVPISLLLHIPMINNQITTAAKPEGRLALLLDKFNFRFSDYILSNSHAGIRNSNPPKHKSSVIHNGFDYERFEGKESHIRQELNISEDTVVIVMAARFSPGKDYETLLKVADDILSSGRDVCFLFVGDGVERARIEELNVGDNRDKIMFLGLRNDVEEILLGSDIGVLLNDKDVVEEGLSNSIMEYMAAGMPVVATDAGGNPEIVLGGETGFLVESKNEKQIADVLIELIDEQELRVKMGEKGKLRIKQDFSIEVFVSQHEKVIRRIIL